MHPNFNNVSWDIIAGWDYPDNKVDMPKPHRSSLNWYPLWTKDYKFIDLPQGIERCLVGFTHISGHPYGRCEILFWQPKERTFSFDRAGKELIDDQLLGLASCWALLPDVPYLN